MKNKKILFITPFEPSSNSGDSFISSGILKGLLKLNINPTVIAFKEEGNSYGYLNKFKIKVVNWDYKNYSLIKKLKLFFSFKPFLVIKFFDQNFLNQINYEIKKTNYDYIIIHGYVMAQYSIFLANKKIIYLEDEDMANIFLSRFYYERKVLKKLFLLSEFLKSRVYQRYFFKKFKKIWLLNEKNINSYSAENAVKNKVPFLVAIKKNIFSIKSKDIVFTGTLNWEENMIGLNWFLKKIWPEVVKKNKINFHIIGKGASLELKNLIKSSKNVIYHGFVDDLVMIYQRSALAISPIFVNFGIKVKILNYLQHGLPVITFSESSSGIISNKGMIIASDSDFADKINLILSDNEKRLNLSKEAIFNIKNFYSLRILVRFLRENL